MAWPTEAGILTRPYPRPRRRRRRRPIVRSSGPIAGKHYGEAWGRYRVFNTAEYRLYRSNTGPPAESNTPFATAASLPATPSDTFADGTWYLAASFFNGLVDSGFLQLGDKGETCRRLDISGGAVILSPPAAVTEVRLASVAGGVVRIVGHYSESGTLRSGEWAIAYTIDGSDPPEDTPDVTPTIASTGLGVLDYALPAQGDGVTVNVRVQTRRNDGDDETPDWRYSEASTVLTATADATGPAAVIDATAGKKSGEW